jgi:hypothetical protein
VFARGKQTTSRRSKHKGCVSLHKVLKRNREREEKRGGNSTNESGRGLWGGVGEERTKEVKEGACYPRKSLGITTGKGPEADQSCGEGGT